MLHGWIASPPRFVLTIGNEGGLLLSFANDQIDGEWHAPGLDDDALAALAEPLSARPTVALAVVVDLVEQSYRRETLPRLSALDRAKVMRRRLESAFPGAPIRGGLALGRAADGSRSDEYLLAGVPTSDDWSRWNTFLRAVPNPVAGVVLLPVEASDLIGRLARAATPAGEEPRAWTVMVTQQRTGGFRQVVVHRGQLMLTRLTPSAAADAPGAEVAAEVQRELRATLGYMTRLGYRAGGGLDVIVIGPRSLQDEIDAPLHGGTLRVVEPGEAAAALRLPLFGDGVAADGTQLLAAWAGRKRRPTLQLLPADLRARMIQRLALRGATAALAASAIGLVSYSALSAVTGLQVEQEIQWLDAWRDTTRTQVDRTAEDSGRIGSEAESMRMLLTADRRLRADRPDPLATLHAVRSAMTRDQQLLGLAWALDRPAATQARRRSNPEPRDFVLDLTLDLGHLDDPAAAVVATERFAEGLGQAFPDRPVMVRRQAVDILPHQAFIGGDDAAGTARDDGMSAELRIGKAR